MNLNITRLECKGRLLELTERKRHYLNITRLECKEFIAHARQDIPALFEYNQIGM